MTDTWQDWLQQQREGVAVCLEHFSLLSGEMRPWHMDEEHGIYGRADGAFWSIVGREVSVSGEKSMQWAQPFIQTDEGSHGYLVLVEVGKGMRGGPVRYLLCADMAPGRQTMELRPTLQTSKSKLEQQPNFPRANLVEMVKEFTTVPCDSNVFAGKTISVGVASFGSVTDFVQRCGPLRPNERWFTKDELREALQEGEVGDHLATALFAALI
jgi:hypothetical protein